MSSLKEKIAVMQAAEMGSDIQRAARNLECGKTGPWVDVDAPLSTTWDWSSWEYRVKPSPPQYRIWARGQAPESHSKISPFVTVRNSACYYNTPADQLRRMEAGETGIRAVTPWLDLPEER